MLNIIFEKLATHYLLKVLANPLIKIHALIIGHRTDIAIAAYMVTYLLEYGNIIDKHHAESARMYLVGAGAITSADKLTRYGSLVDGLIVKAKDLEAEKEREQNINDAK